MPPNMSFKCKGAGPKHPFVIDISTLAVAPLTFVDIAESFAEAPLSI